MRRAGVITLRRIRLGVQKRESSRATGSVITLPTLNYLDLDRILRQDGHWQDLFYTNLRELEPARCDSVARHRSDLATTPASSQPQLRLRVLLSLAVYLKLDELRVISWFVFTPHGATLCHATCYPQPA